MQVTEQSCIFLPFVFLFLYDTSHLNCQTSQIHYSPSLPRDNDSIHPIPPFFPGHSYKQFPPSPKHFFPNHVDMISMPTHPKDVIFPSIIPSCLLSGRKKLTVSVEASASSQCIPLKTVLLWRVLGESLCLKQSASPSQEIKEGVLGTSKLPKLHGDTAYAVHIHTAFRGCFGEGVFELFSFRQLYSVTLNLWACLQCHLLQWLPGLFQVVNQTRQTQIINFV